MLKHFINKFSVLYASPIFTNSITNNDNDDPLSMEIPISALSDSNALKKLSLLDADMA